MPALFNLQIVTPEREVFNGPVDMVSLPGAEGSFGVLRSHAPLIAALDPGEVTIRDENGQETHMAIGGGFFQVADNQAMVLADSAEAANQIDVARAQASEQRARSRLAGQLDAEHILQRERADAALKRAQARLRVAAGR